ncbi:MAG: HemK/PrmC family methyltransferase [Patescibacteria group bacterium]
MKQEVNWLLEEKYKGIQTSEFKKDIKRLEKGEPLDYVIGFAEFLGCKIDLSKRPLIPRAETEYWVKKAITEDLRFKIYDLRVLDIFAGSGCIGISIMRHIKNAHVVFAEKDKKLLEQIKINCKINHKIGHFNLHKNERMSDRYKIIQSDIFSKINLKSKILPARQSLGAGGNLKSQGFDYIFANPPYIPTTKKNKIQKSVLKYEPKNALFGGADGLLYIRNFLADAKDFLNENGKIYMEFDSIQKNHIEKMLRGLKFQKYEFHKDQYGKWRHLVVQ